jgi:hypothetical protein
MISAPILARTGEITPSTPEVSGVRLAPWHSVFPLMAVSSSLDTPDDPRINKPRTRAPRALKAANLARPQSKSQQYLEVDMSTFMALGNEKDGADTQLRECVGKTMDGWTINQNARPGDQALFYLIAPRSSFVAIGTVRSQPQLITSGKWKDSYWTDIDINTMIEPEVSRQTILARFPSWDWMRMPIQSSRVHPEIEVDMLKLLEGSRRLQRTPKVTPSPKRGRWQPDPEQRKRVETAAVVFVQKRLHAEGWKVVSCESENNGYDLRCTQGRRELNVEVKGTTSSKPEFQITQNELSASGIDKYWELWIVTNALSEPRDGVVLGNALKRRFAFTPTQYAARPR